MSTAVVYKLTNEERDEFVKLEDKLNKSNVLIGKFSQDFHNVHVTMSQVRGEDKTLTFTKGGRYGSLDDSSLEIFCTRNILEYFKNWSTAEIDSFFYNQNWVVDSYNEGDSDDCLEKKLQALEDDGYEIHTITNNRIIGLVCCPKKL